MSTHKPLKHSENMMRSIGHLEVAVVIDGKLDDNYHSDDMFSSATLLRRELSKIAEVTILGKLLPNLVFI